MPTIYVNKELLMQQLSENYSDQQFDELCFKFGIELDEVTSEKNMVLKEKGSNIGQESDDVIYKIDIPANRYDLLSLEGLALALRIFTGKTKPPNFKVTGSNIHFSIDKHANSIRPILLGAIVRNVEFNPQIYNSFIDLQDKIHQTIGRKRSIVSIGTHDLDTIKGPFLYTAIRPDELKFTPLNQDREFLATELMEFYADSHLKPYLSLIKDEPRYPVIMDANRTVLSMPPIINGNASKITLNTRNVLIEVTALDRDKANIALDTIVTMLMVANQKFEVESVTVTDCDNKIYITPTMDYHREMIDADYIRKSLGIDIEANEIAKLLGKMGMKANVINSSTELEVFVPPTRHDIIHKCDIMEDVGIAYGYDNIQMTLPRSATIASQVPLNKLSDQLRHEVARCGYTETLNFALCSQAEISELLRRPIEKNIVTLKNPKTTEFQVARTCLLPGLLKTLNSNKSMSLPMKLFEVGDVVFADDNSDVGANNVRHISAIYYGRQTSGFETIHGLLDRIMQVLDIKYIEDKANKASLANGYYIEACQDDAYLAGRCAAIIYAGDRIGLMGILHPEVMTNFELNHPCSSLEMTIEKFPFIKNN